MQTLSYPNGLSQKPGRSLAMIALVGSLHLILVYAVLAALDVVPAPFIPPITHGRVIDTKVQPTPPPMPPVHLRMAAPTTTDNIPAPPINIDHSSSDRGPATPTGGDTTTVPTDVFQPASAVAETHTIPSYPALDRRLNHQGTVLLTVMIDAQGNVSDASVAKSSGYDGLDAAAVAWVKEHWRYKPAMHNGSAVAATARAEVTFRLTQN